MRFIKSPQPYIFLKTRAQLVRRPLRLQGVAEDGEIGISLLHRVVNGQRFIDQALGI